jgi:hypothetical protein
VRARLFLIGDDYSRLIVDGRFFRPQERSRRPGAAGPGDRAPRCPCRVLRRQRRPVSNACLATFPPDTASLLPRLLATYPDRTPTGTRRRACDVRSAQRHHLHHLGHTKSPG